MSVVSAGILFSRILGYVRDVVITSVFGVGGVTDAYLVAFLIPNFFRRLAGEGALSASFIPIYAGKEKSGAVEAERFAGATLSFVFVILALVCALAAFVSPLFVSIFAPGLRRSPEIFDLAGRLLAVLFPYLLLMSLYAVVSGILNTRGRFGVPAAASALENVAVISAALFLVPAIGGGPDRQIWGLAAGVLVGGILQVGVVWMALKGTGFQFRPSLKGSAELSEMLWLMVPSAAALVVYQLNNVINQNIASFLAPGTITVLYLAYRVIEFPAALFGTAVGTVTLPKAAQAASAEEFNAIIRRSTGLCLLWMIPSAAAFISFADPLIGLLFQYGRFTAESSSGVSSVLRVYALALPFIGLTRIFSSACYAVKQPKIPLTAGAVSVGANIIFSIGFVLLLPAHLKPIGIALGMSLAAMANLTVLIRLSRRNPSLLGVVGALSSAPRLALVHVMCSLSFALPLVFLTPGIMANGPLAQKIWTAVAVLCSMGLYFGFLRLSGEVRRRKD